MPTLRENLKQLSEAVGVSGEEREVRQLVQRLVKDHLSDAVIDAMGNLTGRLKSSAPNGMRVMLGAPMDEVGLMVTGSNGFLNVLPVGRLDMRYLAAARVLVGAEKANGVLLFAPIHKSYGQNDLPSADSLLIDVGASGKGGAKVGDRVAFAGSYAELGADVVRGKALHSRAACAVLIALIEALGEAPLPLDIHVAFTAQSRVYGRGALVAANRVKPHAAFLLDGTDCDDLPRQPDDSRLPMVRLGGGTALRVAEGLGVPDRRLLEHVRAVARQHSLPHQTDTAEVYGTENALVSQTQAGVPTVTLSIPVRYLHSPNGLVSLTDLEHTQRLLRESLAALTPDLLEN